MVKPKYFDRRGNRDWSFFGETCDDGGRPTKIWLYYAKSTPIKRHVKVKGEANPYDPTYETYFEERKGAHMLSFSSVGPIIVASKRPMGGQPKSEASSLSSAEPGRL